MRQSFWIWLFFTGVVGIAIPSCASTGAQGESGAGLENLHRAALTAQTAAHVVCRTCRGVCAVIDPQPAATDLQPSP